MLGLTKNGVRSVLVVLGLALPACAPRTLTSDQVRSALGSDRNLVGADLRGAALSGLDLTRARLREANLSGAILDGADLTGADLRRAKLARASLLDVKLVGANLRDADLEAAKLSRADLTGALLMEADLDEAHLDGATLTRANLQEATLDEAHLAGADLREADLTGADLTKADLRGAVLVNARLTEARLREANAEQAVLDGADLSRADLSQARLAGASLVGAQLREAKLRHALLGGANLTGADLRGADLAGASLRGARLDRAIVTGANLQGTELQSARVEEVALEGAGLIPAAEERLITLPPPPTEAQRARIRTLTVVSGSPAPRLQVVVPERSGHVGRRAGEWGRRYGDAVGPFGAAVCGHFLTCLVLGVPLLAIGGAGTAMAAASAALEPTGLETVESALAGAAERVRVEERLRDRVGEFARTHTPLRVIRPPDTASTDAVLDVHMTGLRLVGGVLTVAVRVMLKESPWSAPFYEASFVHISPSRSVYTWAENEGEALRGELDRATRALAERIVEEAFLRYVP